MSGLPLAVFDQIANQIAARGPSSGRERQPNAQPGQQQTPFDEIMAKLAGAAAPPPPGQLPPAMQPAAVPAAPRPASAFAVAVPNTKAPGASDETSAAVLIDTMKSDLGATPDPQDQKSARASRQKRDANLPNIESLASGGAGLDTAQAAVASAAQAFAAAQPAQAGSGPDHAQDVLARVADRSDPSAIQQMLDAGAASRSGTEGHAARSPHMPGVDALPQRQPASDIKQVSFETHLLSGSAPPPALQVADAVIADLKETQAAAPSVSVTQPQAPQPVRILHIALEPVGLGHVSVHLRMVDGHLDLELRSAGHDALRMIDADKETLAASLTNAGYSLDRLVTGVAADSAGSATTGQGGSSAPSEQNSQQGRAGSGERQPDPSRQQAGQNQSGKGYESQTNRGASRSARDLYL